MRVVWTSCSGGAAAREVPEWLGCAENLLGLKEFADAHGHERVLISETGPGLDPLLVGSGMAPGAQRRCAEGVRDSLERSSRGSRWTATT